MKSRVLVFLFSVAISFLVANLSALAQIDSRNQVRPDREQTAADNDKKKKKDRKKRDKRRRLKGRKEIKAAKKREAGSVDRKFYSNRKQIRENSRKSRRARAKDVDRPYYGDIAGRNIPKPRDRNREVTRTYRQPDPYESRRIRTERSRAGPDAPAVRSATRRGERARMGDISGQRTVRQKSQRSARTYTYAQPNPYVGRKIKTEKQRAKSNTKQLRSIRSATRPAEANPPRVKDSGRRGYSISAAARPKVKQKRNVYRNHERTGGEKFTTRDIAGKKLRTRNTRSAVGAAPVPYSSINPYGKGKRYAEGRRFRRTATRYSSARSISRSAESGANRRYDSRYGQHRNRRTIRTSGVVSAKRVRSTSDPRSRGERTIFGDRYSPPPPRSLSRAGESRTPRSTGGYLSASGRRKTYRQRNTYQGKDKHFGENSTTRDIAGRKLRTRNKRSFHPTWSEFGGGSYGTGSVSGKPTKKYMTAGGRRKTRANWNNSGLPVGGRVPASKGESTYTGRLPISAMPSYGPGKEGKFTGRMPVSALPGYRGNQGSTYRGRIKASSLQKYKGGNESVYAGNRKARKRLQGGGSISAFWNNNGSPIAGRGPGPGGESGFTGRLPINALPSYGPGKASTFTGRMPLRGGYGPGKGSTFTGNMPLRGGYGPGKGSTFTGNMPLRGGYGPGKGSTFTGNMPLRGGYGPGKGSTFTGNMPLRGGYGPGKASTFTGNMPLRGGYGPGKASTFTGNMPLRGGYGPGKGSTFAGNMPLRGGYGPGKEGTYQGRQKAYRPLKGGGSITAFWNNKGKPLRKRDRSPIDLASSSYKGSMPFSAMPSYGDGGEGSYQGNMKARKPLKGAGGSITTQWNNDFQPIQGRDPGKYNVGRFAGNMKAKKPLKGAGGSVTTQWNNDFQPIEGKGPGKYDVGRFAGNMPLSALPGYGGGGEGTYQGDLKRKATKIKQSPGTERGRTKSLTFLRVGDPQQMGLTHRERNLKVKNDLPQELSRQERKRIEDAEGVDHGRTKSLSFLSLGNPNQGGLRAELGNKKMKRDLPNEIKGKQRLRIPDADGLDRGRTRSFTFLKLGDPTHGGLHAETADKKRKNDLPSSINGKNRLRLADADGLDNGRARSFSFWAIGDPTRGGLVKSPAQARGRLHPSADYTKPGKYYNSIEKKEQPVKIKLWFAKLFKRNANQPDAVKEKERKPRYNKNEREIWETSEREDWYKN